MKKHLHLSPLNLPQSNSVARFPVRRRKYVLCLADCSLPAKISDNPCSYRCLLSLKAFRTREENFALYLGTLFQTLVRCGKTHLSKVIV